MNLSRLLNIKLSEAPLSLKFHQSKFDQSLYANKDFEGINMVLVYVDDILIREESLKLIENTKKALQETFKINDLGELRYFLCIEFASEKGILMHQRNN